MKSHFYLISIAFIFIFKFTFCQEQYDSYMPSLQKWKCDIIFDNQMGPFSTFLFFNYYGDSSFSANSAENADVRIFGYSKAMLARLFNKSPKKGVFLKINNSRFVHQKLSDSLYGNISIPMVGKLDFSARIINDSLHGNISDSTTIVGTVSGVRAISDSKIDFKNLIDHIFDTTRKYIFDPKLLQTRKWKRFKRKLVKVSSKATDDIEIFFGFNILSQKLPFSHYNLFIFPKHPDLKPDPKIKNIFFEEKSNKTVCLNIKSFGGPAIEMDSIFNLVFSNNYENLIVDLRNNSGGGINSAIPFGQYLTTKKLDAGVFLTNKWFRNNSDIPDKDEYKTIPITEAKTTSAFLNELISSEAKRLVIKPGHKSFQGKIYILTSNKTASTCEPIVDALKKHNIATIVGEKTAGAMLSAKAIQVMDKYFIFLPIADYYTSDGVRIDQNGVEPNIEVESQKALYYVLKNLIK